MSSDPASMTTGGRRGTARVLVRAGTVVDAAGVDASPGGLLLEGSIVVAAGDLAEIGPVIDAAVGAGANRVDGLEFYAADSQEAYMDALARAVERARAEAEVMAAAAGGTLGRIVSLQSNRSGQPVARVMAEGMAMSATPIEPGDQSVGASVRLEVQLLSR